MTRAMPQWCLIQLALLPGLLFSNAHAASVSDAAVLLQAGWATHLGWNTSADVCSWTGVACNSSLVVQM